MVKIGAATVVPVEEVQEQMQALQNAASGLEREYSAFKAASAVREEGLTEKSLI